MKSSQDGLTDRRLMRLAAKILVAIALGTVASPAAAQGAGQVRSAGGDPLELLLNIRRELTLTGDQVRALRDIQARLEQANRPHVERLLEIQREVRSEYVPVAANGPRSRPTRPSDAQIEVARLPLQRIQENNYAAMEQVNALLTDEQKQRAAQLLQVQRRGSERRPNWIRLPSRREQQ